MTTWKTYGNESFTFAEHTFHSADDAVAFAVQALTQRYCDAFVDDIDDIMPIGEYDTMKIHIRRISKHHYNITLRGTYDEINVKMESERTMADLYSDA
jgi:hypothetical protein